MRFFPILFMSLLISFNAHANENASVEKPFNVGFGYYTSTISLDASSATDDDLSGVAFNLRYAFSNALAFNATFFSLEHDDISSIESNGYDLQVYIGQGFSLPGFKAYIGGGFFKDEWELGPFSETFNGLQLSGGLGYNWQSVSVDFVLGVRDASDYEDFINNTLPVNVSATAITTMLSVSARF